MIETPKDDWRTPTPVFHWARERVGGAFDYDAACTLENSLATPLWTPSAGGFKAHDSLSAPWPNDMVIWCNPPYSKIDPWIDAALACKSTVAMLIMSPNGEERFARLLPRAHEIHIVGRIGFLDRNGKPVNGNTRGSSLFVINPPFGASQRTWVSREEIYGSKAA